MTRNQEDEFYADLDKNTEEKSCCSCYTLAIFFILLFCFLSLLVILVFKNYRSINLPELNTVLNQLSNKDFSANAPTIEFPITAEELTSLLQGNLETTGASLSDAEVEINPANIIISGKIKILFTTNCQITIMPKIQDEKVYLVITKVQTLKVSLPGIMRAGLEKAVNNLLDSNLSNFYKSYKATDVQLENGKMIIFGQLK